MWLTAVVSTAARLRALLMLNRWAIESSCDESLWRSKLPIDGPTEANLRCMLMYSDSIVCIPPRLFSFAGNAAFPCPWVRVIVVVTGTHSNALKCKRLTITKICDYVCMQFRNKWVHEAPT